MDSIEHLRGITKAILTLASVLPPEDFSTLWTSIIANVSGNLPQDYWDKMADVKPCDTPGCDCHIASAKLMKAMTVLRKDHARYVNIPEDGQHTRAE
jgi:hypothetical protein